MIVEVAVVAPGVAPLSCLIAARRESDGRGGEPGVSEGKIKGRGTVAA